jgi:hypothetical protein
MMSTIGRYSGCISRLLSVRPLSHWIILIHPSAYPFPFGSSPFRSITATMAAISHMLEIVASSMDMLSRLGRLSLIEWSLNDHGCECVCFEPPHYQSQACQLSTPVLLLRPMRDGRFPRMMKNHQDQGRASPEKYSCRKVIQWRFFAVI